MLNILVIRHAQSEWNQSGRWQGQADPPLTHTGMVQARAAAAALNGIDSVVTSDLDRAHATAVLIAEVLEVGPVTVDADWRERDAGAWQGLTRAEIERDYPGHIDQGRYPPGWEPDSSVANRALAALHRISDGSGSGHVLAVSHAGVIYGLERHLGDDSGRIDHLHGRWFAVGAGRSHLGRRVTLVGHDADPAVTETR